MSSTKPHQKYFAADGKQVPSVTTILGKYKDPGGLVNWARTQGYEQAKAGLPLDHWAKPEAEIGTIAHDMVDADLHGNEYTPPGELKEELLLGAQTAFGAYLKWKAQSRFTIKYTEVPLVSEKYRFGGRLDAVVTVVSQFALFDWKTSKKIYPEYLIQLGGYKVLWEENYPEIPILSLQVIRFGKEHGEFATLSVDGAAMDSAVKCFLDRRALYEQDKKCPGEG